MNEVNKTLFIPLFGKAQVSRRKIILNDPTAERIWESECIPMTGKSNSKWLAYNMAMRARVFDEWVNSMLRCHKDAIVLHIGCGLDSRCLRIQEPYQDWIDCDFPEVIAVRKKYYTETAHYHMTGLNAAETRQISDLPGSNTAIVVLEGLSMYLTNKQLHDFLDALQTKYHNLHILMDVYTVLGAKASKYKNPVNDVGVTALYGIKDISEILDGTGIRLKDEHSFTPAYLVKELKPYERALFRVLFADSIYRRIYRLYELTA